MPSKLTAYDWANVREVDLENSEHFRPNPRRRMFIATDAKGNEHHLIIGWPKVDGQDETIHCFDCQQMNNCEGSFRLHLCLIDERLKEGKKTLLGLTLTGGEYHPGSLALPDEKLNPKLDERAIRVMR